MADDVGVRASWEACVKEIAGSSTMGNNHPGSARRRPS